MQVHIFQPQASEGGVDIRRDVQHGALLVGGGDSCDIAVPGLPDGPQAEVRVAGGRAELARCGRVPVRVAGKDVAQGAAALLGCEVLIQIGDVELVFHSSPSTGVLAPGGVPAAGGGAAPFSETPSAVAKGLLKDVYAALGVPEDVPTVVVYDQDNKMLKRVDLRPPREKVVIGRHPESDIVLYHRSVSKSHAEVGRDGVGFFVKDLGSRNGVEVNGQRVKGMMRLKSGDRISIGSFKVRFVDPKAAVQDLAGSVPDLSHLERASTSGPVQIGGAGDLEETTAFEKSIRQEAGIEDEVAPSSADGSGILLYILIGLGVVALLGVGAFVLSSV